MTTRLALALGAAASSLAVAAPSRAAACTTTPPSVAYVCYANRPVVSGCVHTPNGCVGYAVVAPLCVRGTLGGGYFETVWC